MPSADRRKRDTFTIFENEETDEGSEQERIENKIDMDLFIESLSKEEQVIVRYLRDGWTQRDIAKKIQSHYSTICRQVGEIRRRHTKFFS